MLAGEYHSITSSQVKYSEHSSTIFPTPLPIGKHHSVIDKFIKNYSYNYCTLQTKA